MDIDDVINNEGIDMTTMIHDSRKYELNSLEFEFEIRKGTDEMK